MAPPAPEAISRYLGQLEDDLADLVGEVRKTYPTAPLTLLGHSSGGGFALRLARLADSGPVRANLPARAYLGYDAPTNRPQPGGWASPDLPRFFALSLLRGLGMASSALLTIGTITICAPRSSAPPIAT